MSHTIGTEQRKNEESTPAPEHGTGRYMAGLDGLRTLAVFAVIAYHLNLGFAPGGLLGVGVFFVLSGYLITDILAAKWSRSRQLDLKDFWLRRAKRLLPAVLFLIVMVMAWITLFDTSQLDTLRGDECAALLYVSNWWYIFRHVSYFESFGPPSPLGHLWSLAVEEQFYLFWPLLLWLGLRFVPRRGWLAGIVMALAIVSALAMALLYVPGIDPSRVYYGTDTRAFALLIGASLALVWPSRNLQAHVTRRVQVSLDLAGVAGLLFVLVQIWQTNQYETSLYQGGLLLFSLATAVVVAVLAHPASLLGKVMGSKPLRWLGKRSYGIYLWHYPIIVLTTPTVNTHGLDLTRALLQVLASVVIAALSYRFVEEPIRYGTLGRGKDQTRTEKHRQGRRVFGYRVASSVAAVAFGISFAGLVIFNPTMSALAAAGVFHLGNSAKQHAALPGDTGTGDHVPTTAPIGTMVGGISSDTAGNATVNGTGQANGTTSGTLETTSSDTGTGSGTTANSTSTGNTSGSTTNSTSHDPTGTTPSKSTGGTATPTPPPPAQVPVKGTDITAIGDSLMVDVEPYLNKRLPGITVDGKIGRQMYEFPAVLKQLKADGKLGHTVIIEAGTNGPFTKEQMETMLHSLGSDTHILLINTRVPRPWESVVNSTLAEVHKDVPNTALLNWYDASVGKDSYFYPDGVHLTPDGSEYYASLVVKEVKALQANDGK